MTQTVQHRDGEFFVEREGRRIAELAYAMKGASAVANHTWVDPQFRGGTLARDLVEALATWARAQGHKVLPVCPYVRRVFDEDPRYSDLRG